MAIQLYRHIYTRINDDRYDFLNRIRVNLGVMAIKGYSPELQKWKLTVRCRLVSYSGQPFFAWGGLIPLLGGILLLGGYSFAYRDSISILQLPSKQSNNRFQHFTFLAISWIGNRPVSSGCRIHRLHHFIGVRPHPNECPDGDNKPSGGWPLFQGLWGVCNTTSLPLPSDPLGPHVVVPVRVPSRGQIKLFNHLRY